MHVVSPESDDLDGYSFQESTQWRVVLLWAAWRLTFACDRCDSAAQEYRVSFVRGFRGALPNCQISDFGSDSDTLSNSNSALWAMSRTFSFSITFARIWEYMLAFGRKNNGGTVLPSTSGGDIVLATCYTDIDTLAVAP